MSFDLFVSLLYFSNVLFSAYRSFAFLIKFVPKYLTFFYANGIIFLILFFSCSLLVYINATDFCVLILHPETLLNSFINSNVCVCARACAQMHTHTTLGSPVLTYGNNDLVFFLYTWPHKTCISKHFNLVLSGFILHMHWITSTVLFCVWLLVFNIMLAYPYCLWIVSVLYFFLLVLLFRCVINVFYIL